MNTNLSIKWSRMIFIYIKFDNGFSCIGITDKRLFG